MGIFLLRGFFIALRHPEDVVAGAAQRLGDDGDVLCSDNLAPSHHAAERLSGHAEVVRNLAVANPSFIQNPSDIADDDGVPSDVADDDGVRWLVSHGYLLLSGANLSLAI